MATGRWHEPIDTRWIPLAALIAAVIALAVNIALREVGRQWLDVPADERLLTLLSISITTLAAVAFGAVGLAALAQTQARPFSVFRALAGVVLLVSCVGPLVARLGWIPGVESITTPTMLLMLLMHIATTVVIVAFLTTLPRAREPLRRYPG